MILLLPLLLFQFCMVCSDAAHVRRNTGRILENIVDAALIGQMNDHEYKITYGYRALVCIQCTCQFSET